MSSHTDWIERNLEKIMGMIMADARYQRPLPVSIAMHGAAYRKFSEMLKSRSSFFPDPSTGEFKFLNIPIRLNNNLPLGCFTVERFKTPKMAEKTNG